MTITAIKTKSSDQSKRPPKLTLKTVKTLTVSPRRKIRVSAAPRVAVAPSVMPAPASKITKRDQLAAMLLRDEGATLDQLIAATDWLPHTTRAALSGLRKAGYSIDSDKTDGVRTYRAVAPK